MTIAAIAPAVSGIDIAIRARGVVKSYGAASAPVHALQGVDLEIRRGERVALLGKSGSGKSTLLNLIGGLDRPTSGFLHVAGQDLARLSSAGLAHYRLTTVGMIFQSFNLIASRTALQNVELPLVFAGRSARERRELAGQALAAVGLDHRLSHYPRELSGGEQQRVAIARALVGEPRILLADEPTGNLDSETAAGIVDYLAARTRQNHTILLLVTHDQELAVRHSDRVLHMSDGVIEGRTSTEG